MSTEPVTRERLMAKIERLATLAAERGYPERGGQTAIDFSEPRAREDLEQAS